MATHVSIIYHSVRGVVAEIAQEIAAGASEAGADVRLRRVNDTTAGDAPVASVADVLWADAVVLGSPSRFGNVSAEYKQFIDSLGAPWHSGQLADKVYSGFTATSGLHSGHESTLLAMMTTFHHFSGIVVAPGYSHPHKHVDGNPYGTSHCDHSGKVPMDACTRAAARVQAERVVRIADLIRTGTSMAAQSTGAAVSA